MQYCVVPSTSPVLSCSGLKHSYIAKKAKEDAGILRMCITPIMSVEFEDQIVGMAGDTADDQQTTA